MTRSISATMALLVPFSRNGVIAGLLYLIATPMRALSLSDGARCRWLWLARELG
ncbi:MAG: hypothetical protein ACP5GO_00135 [Thermoprotei archaeon]